MGSGFSKKKKQMRALQEQFSKMQESLVNLVVTGSAGNGLVTVQVNGEYEVLDVRIKPDCVDPEDIEGLQDLVQAAFQDAMKKLKEASSGGMNDLSALGSLGL